MDMKPALRNVSGEAKAQYCSLAVPSVNTVGEY
jgi:hypothetical protein